MTKQQLENLDHYLGDLELPFRHPVVIALIREELAVGREPADVITRRLYEAAGAILPGNEAPLLFEQLIFDLYKEQQESFDPDGDNTVSSLRGRIMTLVDRWMQLTDFLNEEPQRSLPGNEEIQAEMGELLSFVQSLLDRVNRPEEASSDSTEEIAFLMDQSEEVLVRLMEKIEEMLNPHTPAPVTEEEEEKILELSVELQETSVRRKLRVSGRISLDHFHRILQKTLGWWDLYDHSFEQAGSFWGTSSSGEGETVYQEERSCMLQSLLEEEDDMLHYRYDLPEGWHHIIRVDRVLEKDAPETRQHPFCLAGKGACPPEDCGGPEGFRMLMASLKADAPQDLKEDFAWVGDYDPDAFSADDVNRELRELV